MAEGVGCRFPAAGPPLWPTHKENLNGYRT